MKIHSCVTVYLAQLGANIEPGGPAGLLKSRALDCPLGARVRRHDAAGPAAA